MKKISVIVLLYKPCLRKTIITLNSILNQVNIDYEVLISDDGSDIDYFPEIKEYLKKNNFNDYKLIKNSQNAGTVKNCLGALMQASGEYVFLTSPGDLLYDNTTLVDFYNFSRQNDAKIIFGDTVCYNADSSINIINNMSSPIFPEYFRAQSSFADMYTTFLFGNYIVGAAYFRERECAVKYFRRIEKYCVYVEDNTSTSFALADGVRVYYYNRPIVWYETGTGISTSPDSEWSKIIQSEIIQTIVELKKEYNTDPVVDAVYNYKTSKNKLTGMFRTLFKHPIVFLRLAIYFLKLKCKRYPVKDNDMLINTLKKLLSVEENENAGN